VTKVFAGTVTILNNNSNSNNNKLTRKVRGQQWLIMRMRYITSHLTLYDGHLKMSFAFGVRKK